MPVFEKIKWAFYGLTVKIARLRKNKKQANLASKKRGQNLFLFFFLLFPIVQFAVFYFGVNINSILLAFQKFEGNAYTFAGFENFATVINDIFVTGGLITAIKNSGIQFALGLIIGTPIHIMVAYAVFKKVPFSGFFKVMLFLPQMMSSMVFVICAQYLIEKGFPIIFPSLQGVNLLDTLEYSSFWTVLLFGFWMTFAGGLVVYLGAMGSIPQEVMEYGQLEKLSSIKELWYVVVPMIFPTITTYIVVAFAGFFTNQGFFFQFFSGNASGSSPFETLGYVFFVKVIGNGMNEGASLLDNYPYAAAGGLLFTLVCAPLTISVRMLLEKFGPSED